MCQNIFLVCSLTEEKSLFRLQCSRNCRNGRRSSDRQRQLPVISQRQVAAGGRGFGGVLMKRRSPFTAGSLRAVRQRSLQHRWVAGHGRAAQWTAPSGALGTAYSHVRSARPQTVQWSRAEPRRQSSDFEAGPRPEGWGVWGARSSKSAAASWPHLHHRRTNAGCCVTHTLGSRACVAWEHGLAPSLTFAHQSDDGVVCIDVEREAMQTDPVRSSQVRSCAHPNGKCAAFLSGSKLCA